MAHPARIKGLRIDPVAKPGDWALWNTLIAREHPRGMTTFAGRQFRYLVGSEAGGTRCANRNSPLSCRLVMTR